MRTDRWRLPLRRSLFVAVAGILLMADDSVSEIRGEDLGRVALLLCVTIVAAATLPLSWDHDRWRRLVDGVGRFSLALAVATFAFLVALVTAEAATRWTFRDSTTSSDEHGFFSSQWAHESGAVSLNAFGFRDPEWTLTKGPDVFRVAVVGDSFTFGIGLDTDRRFSNLVQRSLGPRYEVLNFGVPGDNTPQHASTIRERVLRFSPDFILVQWFVNDVEGTSIAERPVYHSLVPWVSVNDRLHRSSAFYTLLDSAWVNLQAEWIAGTYADFLRHRFGDPQSAAAHADRTATEDLLSICRSHGVPFGIVLFPDTGYDLGDSYPFDFLHARVLSFCADYSVRCVDLRDDFARIKDRRKLWVNLWDHHPSALANAIAAERILQTYARRWSS